MDITQYQFIQNLIQQPYIKAIYLYGSRGRGDYREKSDIDIAIDCPSASDQEWFEILSIIENADTLLKIDCVRYDALTEGDLKKNIDRDKKIIFERK